MGYAEFQLTTEDNIQLVAKEWGVEQTKGVILLIHGLGEHSGRYEQVAKYFNLHGFAVVAFDQRGHGKSGGARGDCPNYESFLRDISLQKQAVDFRYPNTAKFLYGHSLGGNLGLNFVLRKDPDFRGVIITSPWLRLAFMPPPAKLFAARLLNKLRPSLAQNNGLAVGALTRNEDINRQYNMDPLVHNQITPRLFIACNAAGEWALENAAKFSLPLLLMHGTGDRITSAAASSKFAAQVKDSTIKLWDGWYHELHNEDEGEQILACILDWLNVRLN